MRIDIDSLTAAELVDLNNRIVERLRFLHQMRAHSEMLEFRIGDRLHPKVRRRGRTERKGCGASSGVMVRSNILFDRTASAPSRAVQGRHGPRRFRAGDQQGR